jgi:hypothetical protein
MKNPLIHPARTGRGSFRERRLSAQLLYGGASAGTRGEYRRHYAETVNRSAGRRADQLPLPAAPDAGSQPTMLRR